jgi:hypothetical protein
MLKPKLPIPATSPIRKIFYSPPRRRTLEIKGTSKLENGIALIVLNPHLAAPAEKYLFPLEA